MRPRWIVADRYAWCWLSATIEPSSGQRFFLLPRVDTSCLQVFLDALRQQVAGEWVGLGWDGSEVHRSARLVWPDHLVPLALPPSSLELNPAERIFAHLRANLADRILADLRELEDAVSPNLQGFWAEPALLSQLTGYGW